MNSPVDQLADLPLFAARESSRVLAGEQRRRLATWLEQRGHLGGTQDEASFCLGTPRQTLCFRFRELEAVGVIAKTDRKRPTLFGRLAAVYVYRSILP